MHDATWKTITFTSRADMAKWLDANGHKVTHKELWINTTPEEAARGILNCGLQYKALMRVY